MLLHSGAFKKRMRGALYEVSALVALCNSIVVFFVSSYASSLGLEGFTLASLYVLGSLVSVGNFLLIPWYIRTYGTRAVLLVGICAFTGGLYLTALASSLISLLVPFMLVSASFGVIISLLDVYVEHSTDTSHTEGDVRGLFLGMENISYILGPLMGGLVLSMGGYSTLFIAASLCMVPALAIAYEHLGAIHVPHTAHPKNAGLNPDHLRRIWHMRTLRDTYLFYMILRIFFALFGVYMALFLHDVHGFSYASIGTLIAISLIPMAVVEIPTGHLLGRVWHHRHVGMAGFIVLATTAAVVPSLQNNDFVTWALLLFAMRIGAALVEITAETYFFSLAGKDAEKAALFRATFPLSFIIGPVCATLVMSFFGYTGLFTLLCALSLCGAYLASTFVDIRVRPLHGTHA